MENFKQIPCIFTTIGLLHVVILAYNNGIGSSIAQQQNETSNQTQLQNQEPEFLKNSTSFGNATADLKIKHAPEFSTLTIQPWPLVQEFW